MRVILLAPPGAGKGTQGERIATRYDVPHISSGDLFRQEVASGSELGQQLRAYVEAGDLVPDSLVVQLIADRVVEATAESGGYVLDGFPRTLPQAEAAAEIAMKTGATAQAALHLDAPREVLIERLAGRGQNRADDSEEVVRHRLEVYDSSTKPLIDFYSRRGILMHIDASLSIDDVSKEIYRALDPIRDGEAGG
jgi:adenylate kinase